MLASPQWVGGGFIFPLSSGVFPGFFRTIGASIAGSVVQKSVFKDINRNELYN